MSMDDLPVGTGEGYNPLPIVPAQRPVGLARLIEDSSDTVVYEILILPNMIFFFERDEGVLIGDSVIVSPQFARNMADDDLPERAAHANGCDCPFHNGRHMEVLSPDAV